ncbi:MAG: DUF3109 family protein [Bacteroidaceae bacterium]|nr:DUF3109 family protein [Bacteroidaceae bacterium]
MLEILNTLVSLDLFKVMFCCDLSKCHGICCVEGDAGAPVEIEEVGLLEDSLDVVWDELSKEAQQQIDAEGVVYPDRDGDLVTSIVNGKDCVFVKYDNISLDGGKTRGPRCALCAIDSAYRNGKFHWQKPISCALYPVRVSTIGGLPALNVHKWDICEPARQLGKKLQIPVYKFLKEPLIRRFGQEWWDECDIAYGELKKAGYLD